MMPGSPPVHAFEPDTELRSRYCAVRELTEVLAAPLSAEDQTAQSMPDVSPTKWHRAHTTWFFETFVLQRFDPAHEPVEPAYQELFNSYYESVGNRYPRHERGVVTRPGAAEIGRYRAVIDGRVTNLLDRAADGPTGCELVCLADLGLHHEQQHQELLLMDIKHVLSRNPLCPVYRPSVGPTSRSAAEPRWIDIPGGLVDVGHPGDVFSFDNEAPRHRVHLEAFALSDRLVTAGEWQAFIDDGGYRRPEMWLSDGWATVQSDGWTAPLYWSVDGDAWLVHTLGGTRPLEPTEPVCHVSHYEADAYARWAGARLPTEDEWEVAATTVAADDAPNDLGSGSLHPRPASPAAGVRQLSGDVWEWTATPYRPYPGFRPPPGAIGEYNGKFMCNQMTLRGGACVTPAGHTRPTYRNFFPPSARWTFSGLRLAADA